jgi:hypothetical protein
MTRRADLSFRHTRRDDFLRMISKKSTMPSSLVGFVVPLKNESITFSINYMVEKRLSRIVRPEMGIPGLAGASLDLE